MRAEEIKAYNDVNWKKLQARWEDEELTDMLSCAEISPVGTTELVQNYEGCGNRPYTCTVFFDDESIIIFDFANRLRLRNKMKFFQKNNNNIIGSIICLKRSDG